MRKKMVRSVLAVIVYTAAAAPATAQVADHLKCYRIKDPLKLAGTADLNTPQFGTDAGCILKNATLFCVPATKTNVTATDKATGTPITPLPVSGPQPGDRICYKAKCPNLLADQSVTDQFGNRTVSKFKASLLCTPAFKGAARFVDNGDGTVTDNYTGLQWEKKTTTFGSGTNYADPHDVDNTQYWGDLGGCAYAGCPNGDAFNQFLGLLNNCTTSNGTAHTSDGFAGHCDWRLPTIHELKTILDISQGACGGGSGPCIDPIFGPTAPVLAYWSSTTDVNAPYAWYADFINGFVNSTLKSNSRYARAVRGSS